VIWSDRSNPERACNFWAPEMHNVDGRWYLYFSSSVCDEDWGIVLPSLRVYVLGGGVENPLSGDYEMLGPIVPPNFDHGMLDAVSVISVRVLKYPRKATDAAASTESIRH
jgi:GH43 family beta-xylosidase